MGQEVKRFFRRIIPDRRHQRSLTRTIIMLVAVIFLIGYLLKVVQAG
ncbi:MAG: hypothetical protein QF616_00825 [Candidatus Marinimicrobia bacterium]|jgi:hypothetical protein|nr:hypothetical protein [Candidatus Neomarinimicrobiota bacterium]MDP6200766.1 hypothetical protein [Candidatus Neomarinimicrobiota bacterium]MDP6755013.1 hypothetical protein [Candidatus Neomarinimicrobiota bacterium]